MCMCSNKNDTMPVKDISSIGTIKSPILNTKDVQVCTKKNKQIYL